MHESKIEAIASNFKSTFDFGPKYIAVAPGRVNIIGEHVDHQGYSVLPVALQMTVDIAYGVNKNRDHFLEIQHVHSNIFPSVKFGSLEDVRIKDTMWYNYVIAGLFGIMEYSYYNNIKRVGKSMKHDGEERLNIISNSKKLLPEKGLCIMLDGNVPIAAGVSSSSAVTVATSMLFMHLFGLKIDRVLLASLCSHSEQYSGTLGGGMDQAAILNCDEGIAQHIEFNPLRCTPVHLPKEAALIVCNTGVQAPKAVQAATCYNKRIFELKISCYLLFQFLIPENDIQPADIAALNVFIIQKKSKLTHQELIDAANKVLPPGRISKEHLDSLIGVSVRKYLFQTHFNMEIWRRNQHFELLSRVLHVLTESMRVEKFIELAQKRDMNLKKQMQGLGKLLNESHNSLNLLFDCSCPELEKVCQIAKEAGAYGARLTGAGWGGCGVFLISRDNVDNCLKQLRTHYFENNVFVDARLKAHMLENIPNFVFSVIPSSKARLYNEKKEEANALGKKKTNLIFNEDSLRDFVSGFHERKVKRREQAQKLAKSRLKQQKRESKKQNKREIHKNYLKAEKLKNKLNEDTVVEQVIEDDSSKVEPKQIEIQNDEFYKGAVKIIMQPLEF